MSIIKLPMLFEGSQGEKHLYALFDSGATFSCISAEVIEGLEIITKLRRPLEVATAARNTYDVIKRKAPVFLPPVGVITNRILPVVWRFRQPLLPPLPQNFR